MTRKFTTFFCERCHQARRFTKRFPDFSRHLVATILTFGLWGAAWYVLHRREISRPWRCCVCSHHQMPNQLPNERAKEVRSDEARAIRRRVTVAPLAAFTPRHNFLSRLRCARAQQATRRRAVAFVELDRQANEVVVAGLHLG